MDRLDGVERGTGCNQQTVTDLDQMLGDDVDVAGEETIEDREDASGGGVLDREYQPIDIAVTDRLECK
jgi:hypothetical protein